MSAWTTSKTVNVYSQIYHRKYDILSNVACDLSKSWFYVSVEANLVKNNALESTLE